MRVRRLHAPQSIAGTSAAKHSFERQHLWPSCPSSQFSPALKSPISRGSRQAGCYNFVVMFNLFRLWLGAVVCLFRTRRSLMLENLALRQQLAVLKRKPPRPRLGALDKLFWVVARRLWSQWQEALVLALPDTVVRWARENL